MMYDTTDGGRRLRLYNSLNLAWWHTFKHVSMKIWNVFARDVFAHLWHHLYPGHIFFSKPSSFVCVLAHFTWLFMARDQVQNKLAELLTSDDLSPVTRAFACDMDFLLNVAIPVVSVCRNVYKLIINIHTITLHSGP